MDPHPDLFADGNETSGSALPIQKARPVGIARVQKPNRKQLELRPSDLESRCRKGPGAGVRGYVERRSEGPAAGMKTVEGGVGRSATPRRFCRAVAVRHARRHRPAGEITRLTQVRDGYRWICGGVQVNYHTVADFRSRKATYWTIC